MLKEGRLRFKTSISCILNKVFSDYQCQKYELLTEIKPQMLKIAFAITKFPNFQIVYGLGTLSRQIVDFRISQSNQLKLERPPNHLPKFRMIYIVTICRPKVLYLYRLRGPEVVFCHFFSKIFYIIRLLKTTYPIKFFDSSN